MLNGIETGNKVSCLLLLARREKVVVFYRMVIRQVVVTSAFSRKYKGEKYENMLCICGFEVFLRGENATPIFLFFFQRKKKDLASAFF